jgi:hypothetical protein
VGNYGFCKALRAQQGTIDMDMTVNKSGEKKRAKALTGFFYVCDFSVLYTNPTRIDAVFYDINDISLELQHAFAS